MAQRSVLLQTTQPGKTLTRARYQWMRYFFSEDVSPDNRPIIDLQRRAVWVALALILQSLNEIDHNWYFPYLQPFGSLIPFALILGSFVALWMAFRPGSMQQKRNVIQRPHRWQRVVLILTLILSIAGFVQLGRGVVMCFLPPQFTNDGTSLDTNAAMLLIQGRNPYTDSNMLDMYRKFKLEPNWTTPLRLGQFADRTDYPSLAEFRSVLDTALKGGGAASDAPEFESKVSYPALAFLTLVPFALFQNYNVLPFYLLSYLVLAAIAWKVSRPELRPWVLLLTMANIPMWASTVGGNLDIFYTLLIVLAWLYRSQRWRSVIFLGLAIASKQIAWFFLPFYIIMIWRQHSLREALQRAFAAGMLGLAINLPFILWNPQAWLAGILTPVADPMFPMGIGIINLSVTHLIPYLPDKVYLFMEMGAVLGCLVAYWFLARRRPEAAMLLAVVPLFFAWRSLPSYFACAAYPLFVLLASNIKPSYSKVVVPTILRKLVEILRLPSPQKAPASI
jgi:uncharacterized membrane protein